MPAAGHEDPVAVRTRLDLLAPLELFRQLFLAPLSLVPVPFARSVVLVIDAVDVGTSFSSNPFLQVNLPLATVKRYVETNDCLLAAAVLFSTLTLT